MIKKINLILLILLIFIMIGCKDENESAFDTLWKSAPEETLAVLINLPTEEQERNFPADEKLILEQTEERFLLIPTEDVEEIVIWSLDYEDVNLPRIDEIYKNVDPDDDFVLDLTVMRPEGAPHYQLALAGEKGVTYYYISYNGKDGNPNIEYIIAK